LLFTTNFNNVITGNNITTAGASNNHGIHLFTTSHNNTISNNNIFATGVNNNRGIYLQTTAVHNTITNNFINVNGTGFTNIGITLQTSANNNTIDGNNITTNGTSVNNFGIRIQSSSHNNTFTSNRITTGGGTSHAVRTDSVAFFTNTVFTHAIDWIRVGTGEVQTNFTNTTFETQDGSIRIIDMFNATTTVDRSELNITSNKAFLNSDVLNTLNLSAEIILKNITFTNPKIVVDLEDDGTFVDCASTQCNNLSFTGGIFIFNVTRFTTYKAGENISSGGAPATIGSSGGGGGGGSHRSYFAVATHRESEVLSLDIAQTQSVIPSTQLTFDIKNSYVPVKILSINDQSVTLTVKSQQLTVNLGQEETIDTNNDGVADLAIRVESILLETARISFALVKSNSSPSAFEILDMIKKFYEGESTYSPFQLLDTLKNFYRVGK